MLSVWLWAAWRSRALVCSGRSPWAARSRLTRQRVAARMRSTSDSLGTRPASGQLAPTSAATVRCGAVGLRRAEWGCGLGQPLRSFARRERTWEEPALAQRAERWARAGAPSAAAGPIRAQAPKAGRAAWRMRRRGATGHVSARRPAGMSRAGDDWTPLRRGCQGRGRGCPTGEHAGRPKRERAAPAGEPAGALQSERAPEDLAHDLVAAAADRPQARVAGGALDEVLAHVAGAAMDLQAVVHQLEGGPLGEQLGHRDLLQGLLAGDEAAQCVIGHAAARVDAGGEVCELVADGLVAGQRAPEGRALPGELDGALPGDLHGPDRAEGHRQALPLEVGHDQLEALVERAEQVLLRHEDVLEGDRRRVGGVPAELLELGRADALAAVDDEEGDAVVPALAGCLGSGDDEVRAHAVGDVGLLAAQHPAAVDALGAGGDGCHVRAGARLGDGQRADLLAADRGHEVALLLLLGAELPDRRRGDVDVRPDPRGGAAGAGAGHLLAEDGLVQVVAALPAVGLRVLQPQQPLGGHLSEYLVGEPALLLPALGVRRELALDEAADRLSQFLVLVGEGRGERAHGDW